MGVLSAPLHAFLFIAEQVAERAERALYGEEELRAALTDLYAAFESGRISDDNFEQREDELLRRLAVATKRRRYQ